jgi:hypothetical protein
MSDAMPQRDAGHRATAAASGTVGSTFVEASRVCRTTVDHVRRFVASGWKRASWTVESGNWRLADMIDD